MGCAITGMANVIQSNGLLGNGMAGPLERITPDKLNIPSNFKGSTTDLNWDAVAKNYGMTATYSRGGGSGAQAMVLSANMSSDKKYVLAQVPITTGKGASSHWVGVDGGLKDLNSDGNLWLKVSPTSLNDGPGRTNNPNWTQEADGSMYVQLSSITGAVTIE
jgi:hypothetical protein